MGINVIEQLNLDWRTLKPIGKPINVYITKKQLELLDRFLIKRQLFDFYEKLKIAKLHVIKPSKEIKFKKIILEPILFPKSDAPFFLIKGNKKKVIYAPCEFKNFKAMPELKGADLLIAHMLWFEDPEFFIDFPWKDIEDSFEHMLKVAKKLEVKRIVITYIDECFDLSFEDFKKLEKEKFEEYNLQFAFDGMKLDI